ncbi:MAG: hypothetical protein O2854_08155, partial [Chloroflexi bacterium]|nr:hypothetical protein [Chloroflexota bacterium]
MFPDFAEGKVLWEAVFGAIVFGAGIIIAFIVHPLISRFARLLAGKTKTTLDDLLIQAIQAPTFILILVIGLFVSLTNVSYLERWQGSIDKAWIVSVSVMVLVLIQRIVSAFITWYGRELASRTQTNVDDKLVPLVRRLVIFAIYSIGFLLILNNLGVEIS